MKILYLHQYFNTPEMSGGTRSYEMARRFVAAGHEVHMITSRRDSQTRNRRWEQTVENGIKVYWYPIPYNNSMGYIERIKAFVKFVFAAGKKAVKIGGDVVFATSTPLTIALPAVHARKKLGIPMVFEVRDLWPEVPISIGAISNPVLKYLAGSLEKYAYKNSSQIVALSPGMGEGIARKDYPKDKIHIIPNSSDTGLYLNSEEYRKEYRAKNPWINDHPLVVYIGTFGKINGVGYLIDIAVNMLSLDKRIRFLLVGKGAEFDEVKEKAVHLGVLDRNVYIMPSVPKSEVPEILSAADISTSLVIALPELWNNSANKFFDSLASGTPVAINYKGWQADLLEKEKAGIVLPPTNAAQAASLLFDFLHDSKKLKESAINAKKLAYERFDRDKLALQLLKIIESVGKNS